MTAVRYAKTLTPQEQDALTLEEETILDAVAAVKTAASIEGTFVVSMDMVLNLCRY